MQAFPDNAARREVEALAAVCPNEGCTWAGTIKEFEVHFNAKQTHNSESNVHLFSLLQVGLSILVCLCKCPYATIYITNDQYINQ